VSQFKSVIWTKEAELQGEVCFPSLSWPQSGPLADIMDSDLFSVVYWAILSDHELWNMYGGWRNKNMDH